MTKTMITILAVVLVLFLVCGILFNLTRKNEDPDVKKVLINYVIDGETKPFDSYYAEHAVGEQLRIVSPTVNGYEPRIPVYAARVNSDMNITVYYDFKAPEIPARKNAILYSANFDGAQTLEEAFNNGVLTLTGTGSLSGNHDAEIQKNMLHVSDYGRIELTDVTGIFNTDSYTVSFAMLFESFNEKSVATAFSWCYSKYDGGTSSRYGKAMRLDTSGKVYLNDATHVSALETNKWYVFTIHVDTAAKTNELFINGVSFGKSAMQDPNLAEDVILRFFNTDSRTAYYMDNLVIYKGEPVKN